MTLLHIFAVNADNTTRHTHLTRTQGEAPLLPPLADWLSLERLDTGRIELFPVKDLEGVALSDYITAAFDPVPAIDAETRSRLNALKGSVLLVPDRAMEGEPSPGPKLTQIATLPLAQADHSADLPKAEMRPPAPEPADSADSTAPDGKGLSPGMKLAIFVAIFVILFIVLGG